MFHVSETAEFQRHFQILISNATNDPDLVELFGGTVSLLMSWRGLMSENSTSPPVKNLILVMFRLSAHELICTTDVP